MDMYETARDELHRFQDSHEATMAQLHSAAESDLLRAPPRRLGLTDLLVRHLEYRNL